MPDGGRFTKCEPEHIDDLVGHREWAGEPVAAFGGVLPQKVREASASTPVDNQTPPSARCSAFGAACPWGVVLLV